MKIVHHVPIPCDCHAKLRAFERAPESSFFMGTIVECDCGKQYKLVDDQRDGIGWQWHHPDSGDMGMR